MAASSLALCLLAAYAQHSVFAAVCYLALPLTSYEVHVSQQAAAIRHDVPSRALSHMLPPASQAGHALGATRAMASHHSEISLATLRLPLHGVCATANVRVALGFSALEVYVAREIETDSCLFKEVLAHENLHVREHRLALNRVRGLLQDVLARRYGQPEVFFFDSKSSAEDDIRAGVDNSLAPLVHELLSQQQPNHGHIDTPAEYARLTHACPHEPRPRF